MEGNHKLEIIWTAIPLLLVLVLAVPTIQKVFAYGENDWNNPDAVKVEVTSHQFWWEFNYPDYGVRTAQELVVPVGKKIAFQLKRMMCFTPSGYHRSAARWIRTRKAALTT